MSNPNIKNYGFGTRSKEFDDEARKKSHEVGRGPRVWTKEKCVSELDEILQILKKILKDDAKVEKDNPRKLKQESIRDLNTLMNRILDFMRYLYPPVQTNVNVNVDMTVDAVIERLKNWKKKKQDEVVIISPTNDKQTSQDN